MSPSEYESFIADVVRKFDCGSEAKVLRNARFPGIRQPGDYEIDLALSFNVANALDFLVIVECKNWSRPVDRPVVQKLAQTKDAIGAHKAALVSPVGFSKEAVEVASVFGIALWVLSKTSWTVIMASSGVGVGAHLAYQKRKAYLDGLPFRFTEASDGFELVSFASAQTHQESFPFVHDSYKGTGVNMGSGIPGFDPRLAMSQLVDAWAKRSGIVVPDFDPIQ